jgi:hypothetical protein
VISFAALWTGPDAERFISQHPALQAGACLDIDLDRLHARADELRCYITRCSLAPSRWPSRRLDPPGNARAADVTTSDWQEHHAPAEPESLHHALIAAASEG